MRAFRVAYDGQPYHGFQRQPDVSTVEDDLFAALRRLDVLADDASKPRGYAAAGRTDAGVSAVAQTVAFEAPDWLTPAAFNSELPAAVRAWASADVNADFHATVDASTRTYQYFLRAPDASVERARAAATRFEGTHDFHNFTSDTERTVRAVESATIERSGPFLVFRVEGDSFVREQVRRMVSLVSAVASGDAPPERVDTALSEVELTGPDGIPAAPPAPLVLVDVSYPDASFVVDEAAAESAREVFESLRNEHETSARVAGSILDGI